jgi:hypothetical protein
MSFTCQHCGEAQKDGTTPTLVVVEQRRKQYPVQYNEEGSVIDKGGTGLEIAKEIQACEDCATKLTVRSEE